MNKWEYAVCGIPDNMFIRDNVPMTKQEVRAISISKLKLNINSAIVDFGAGTGSVSIECALIAKQGKVYSIEAKNQAIELIYKNINEFNVKNITVIQGRAPDIIPDIKNVDRVFLGGTGGNMLSILDWVDKNLKIDGIIVANFITPENVVLFMNEIRKRDYIDYDVAQISVAKGKFIKALTIMEGQNPVYIVSVVKCEAQKR